MEEGSRLENECPLIQKAANVGKQRNGEHEANNDKYPALYKEKLGVYMERRVMT